MHPPDFMKLLALSFYAALIGSLLSWSHGAPLSDSDLDWSGTGTQGENGWTYGYREVREMRRDYHPHQEFTALPASWWTGNFWDTPNGNPPWTEIRRTSAHPGITGKGIQWPIRRWEAAVSNETPIAVRYVVRKTNTNCGDGVTAAVAINGRVLSETTIAFDDAVGVEETVYLSIGPGDVLDLIQTPAGTDGDYANDGCDGATMWMKVDTAADTDMDGLGDQWERDAFGNLNQSGTNDPDNDGVNNLGEQRLGTDPDDPDSDDDTLLDGVETATWIFVNASNRGTNPTLADTDGDGLRDDLEDGVLSSPLLVDTDGDDFDDAKEVLVGTDPIDPLSHPANGSGLIAYWDFDDASLANTSADRVAGRIGSFESGAAFTADGGGHSGASGDRALDLGSTQASQRMSVAPTQWLDGIGAKDTMTVSFWQRLIGRTSSSAFWFTAPSEERAAQAHAPWSDNWIHWDTGSCCGNTYRTSAEIPAATDVTSGWHHFAFVKEGSQKQIWLNGVLLREGVNVTDLPLDMELLSVGATFGGWGSITGQIDEFAIFADALTPSQIGELASNTADPWALGGIIDSDNDGLGDDWETHFGLQVGVNDAALDPDLDGHTNADEYRRGTDPTVNPTPFYSAGSWRVRMVRSRDALWHLDSAAYQVGVLEILRPRHPQVTDRSLTFERLINFKEQLFDNGWLFGSTAEPFPILGAYMPENHFAMEVTGQIYQRADGDVTLGFNSDDGGALWVDGELVTLYNQSRGRGTSLGTVTLTEGLHDVRFVYWAGEGGSGVTLIGGVAFGEVTEATTKTVDVLQAFDIHAVATADSDLDGIDDFKERHFFNTLARNGSADFDNDTLADAQEFALKTDPTEKDTDGDGIVDAEEVSAGSDPTQPNVEVDTDNDGFDDDYEKLVGTDPLDNLQYPGSYRRPLLRVLTYSQDFNGLANGTLDLPDGSHVVNVRQEAASVQSDALRLTAIGSYSALANFVLPDLGDGATQGFSAKFRFSLNSPGTAADGFSFNYGAITPSLAGGEEGFGSGLSVEFDTYTNGAEDPIGYAVALDGVDLPGGSVAMPVPVDGNWHSAEIRWKKSGATSGTLDFEIDGSPIFANLSTPGFTPCSLSRFIFAARTGGATEDLLIDDIEIVAPRDQTDSDADTLIDAWERAYFPNLAQAANGDPDNDTLTNSQEQAMGTSPMDPDSDGDGIGDQHETTTDPSLADTDHDGLADGREINDPIHPTNPNAFDTDGDGRGDYHELWWGTDPNDASDHPEGASLPFYSYFDDQWIWRIEKLRVLWDHRAAAPIVDAGGTSRFFGIAAQNRSEPVYSAWELGFRYHTSSGSSFYVTTGPGVLENRDGYGIWRAFWDTPSSWEAALGLAGRGASDESDPLVFDARLCPGEDAFSGASLSFHLHNEHTGETLVDARFPGKAPASLQDQTAEWFSREWRAKATMWSAPGIQWSIGGALAPPDTDNDGMSDAFEIAHAFDWNDPADALLDADMDGLTNAEEALWMTDPRKKDSDGDDAEDGFEVHRGYLATDDTSFPPYAAYGAPTSPLGDINGNGVSDLWEVSYGLPPGWDSLLDLDGDGQNNAFESLAGTDPWDRSSMLEPVMALDGSDVDIQWDAVPGKRYQLMASENLSDWKSLGTWDGETSSIVEVLSGHGESYDRHMYRVDVAIVDTDHDGVSDDAERIIGTAVTRSDSGASSEMGVGGAALAGDYIRLIESVRGAASGAGPGVPSRSQAARFLMQASFGATLAEIDQVVALGYEGWIDEQITQRGLSLHEPYIAELWEDHRHGFREVPNYQKGNFGVPGNNATTSFFRGAVQGSDQLRQRVAFALSQILVASRQDSNLVDYPQGMCSFYDILVRHAFGNYEDILWEVSMHPVMGRYLSHIGNQKADATINRFPDENYAREIMQLFTIGLWELAPNGERLVDGAGEPMPTYDNDVIKELARVFTGIWFGERPWGDGGWDDSHYTKPMGMHADRHDFGEKAIFTNRPAPGRPDVIIPARAESEANGLQDIRDAVAMLFEHPNTPPFICRQLIQFLVTANPSPDYVKRVQDVFVDNGVGERGDLGAVIKAILLDVEAREPRSLSDEGFGKLKEPVLRITALARAFNLGRHPDLVWWDLESLERASFQIPSKAPSVFNFYRPDYQAPGEVRAANLVSPVFQIADSFTSIAFPNHLWELLSAGFPGGRGGDGVERFGLDYQETDVLNGDAERLVDRMNLLFCGGQMSVSTRDALILAINALPAESPPRWRAVLAAYLTLCSPDGAILR